MSRKKHAAQAAAREWHAQHKPLRSQVRTALKEQCAFGTSKYADKAAGVDTYSKIYSHSTYENYLREGRLFVDWCEREHGCSKLEECKELRVAYIEREISRGMSASTIKKRAAAVGKLFGDSILDKIETPDRRRSEITRSREKVDNDLRFSEKKHARLVEFCRSTGLRRHELRGLRGEQLRERDGRLWIEGVKGKGGKVRDVPVSGDVSLVKEMMSKTGLIFPKGSLDKNADIHSYRADYACRLYHESARDLSNLNRSEVYCCRGDMAGRHYDKAAMQKVSWALGHNRIEIVASNYLYDL